MLHGAKAVVLSLTYKQSMMAAARELTFDYRNRLSHAASASLGGRHTQAITRFVEQAKQLNEPDGACQDVLVHQGKLEAVGYGYGGMPPLAWSKRDRRTSEYSALGPLTRAT